MIRDIGIELMEERKHKRIQYARTVNVKTRFGPSIKLDILDYSMGGMSLESRTAFDQGELLEFEYLITWNGKKRVLDLKGEIIHRHNDLGEYTHGVCFL